MSKSAEELATEILVAALNGKYLATETKAASTQASQIASAYKTILAAVKESFKAQKT
ncbi:MAG: hypothetical protein J0H59_16240 [Comamonadaceae bacterium]|nr:hypothetical protein [Comamonadaceae bacterium]